MLKSRRSEDRIQMLSREKTNHRCTHNKPYAYRPEGCYFYEPKYPWPSKYEVCEGKRILTHKSANSPGKNPYKPGASRIKYVRKERNGPPSCDLSGKTNVVESPLIRADSPQTSCSSTEMKFSTKVSAELNSVVSQKSTVAIAYYYYPKIRPNGMCQPHLIPLPSFVTGDK